MAWIVLRYIYQDRNSWCHKNETLALDPVERSRAQCHRSVPSPECLLHHKFGGRETTFAIAANYWTLRSKGEVMC